MFLNILYSLNYASFWRKDAFQNPNAQNFSLLQNPDL